jgi:signal transduction histidine kinase
MPNAVLDRGVVSFKSEGRLLQELGLRLVASPEVALVELIKNAYDADSIDCLVSFSDKEDALIVADHGHGMTLDDFITKWMSIATSSKTGQEVSPRFGRPLTGSKGIGRFAVRYLGDHLSLESTALDKKRRKITTLKAEFDWPILDATSDLSGTNVHYTLRRAAEGTPTGTRLRISSLRTGKEFARSRELRAAVLRMVSPTQGLDRGKFEREIGDGAVDPGFRVSLPGDSPSQDADLARLVLKNYWARLTISLTKQRLTFRVWFPTRTKPSTLDVRVNTTISKGLFCDVRFFPRRKGIFQGKEVSGRAAWSWVRDNSGVAVIDHGFRIRPYGFTDDDWLMLDLDAAHNERNWRSRIAKEHFPIPPETRARPADDPALNLPHNSQLVGAVFVESARSGAPHADGDLIPAMDREGLLGNRGFAELQEYVRAGLEYLALCDKRELERLERENAEKVVQAAREDVKKAIAQIQASDTIAPSDKARIVKQYHALAERLEEQEEYSAKARRSLMTMSLLGIVAGFMTHESDAMLHELGRAANQVGTLAKKHPSLQATSDELSRHLEVFRGYLKYTKLFIQKVRDEKASPFSASGQVRFVMTRFKQFAEERGIEVSNEVPGDVMAPAVSVAAYSGVLLNLYTNALKAVIAVRASVRQARIVFRGWNEPGKHIVEVLDNGVGIPVEMHKRIWDPMYTTTADPSNPLGSGMGLGLTLVKQVVTELGGSISLVTTAPPGFSTCFRVTYPFTEADDK